MTEKTLLKTENLIRDIESLANPPEKPIRDEWIRRVVSERHFTGVRPQNLAAAANRAEYSLCVRSSTTGSVHYLSADRETVADLLKKISADLYHYHRRRMTATLAEAGLLNSYKNWFARKKSLPGIEKLVAAAELMFMQFELVDKQGIAIPTARVVTWSGPALNRKTKKLKLLGDRT